MSVVSGRVLIMFKGWWHVRPEEERQQWMLEPFTAVGPLRFGMDAEEVTQALLSVTEDVEHRTWSGGRGNNTWRPSEGRCREFGLHLYYLSAYYLRCRGAYGQTCRADGLSGWV
ncbi:hypothetical protein ACFWIQ_09675 [Kitasatospora sp. NPDC127059]|uniref:hypothetical protein n=1 Tax=unclassified Kitasatospora TaxID=2633591 RepID=UPI003647DF79